MRGKIEIPVCRNPDSIYFRGVRDGRYTSCYFSGLTGSEQNGIMAEYDAEQSRRHCLYLCSSSHQIGDTLDLVFGE